MYLAPILEDNLNHSSPAVSPYKRSLYLSPKIEIVEMLKCPAYSVRKVTKSTDLFSHLTNPNGIPIIYTRKVTKSLDMFSHWTIQNCVLYQEFIRLHLGYMPS